MQGISCSFLWGQSPLFGFRLSEIRSAKKEPKKACPTLNSVTSDRRSRITLRFRLGGIFQVLFARTLCVALLRIIPCAHFFPRKKWAKEIFPETELCILREKILDRADDSV
jgi:hypothetical protein